MIWNAHSYYSLHYGTLSVEDLVKRAQQEGHSALGLTDINCGTGIFEFVRSCREAGIRPLVGIEFRDAGGLEFCALAKNASGLREINRMLSRFQLEQISYAKQIAQLEHTYIIYPFRRLLEGNLHELAAHELIGIALHELNKLAGNRFEAYRNKLVLQHSVCFGDPAGYLLHQHLRAVDQNVLLSRLHPSQLAHSGEYMLSEADLIHACRYHPFLLYNTRSMMERCEFNFDFKTHKNKKYYSSSAYDDKLLLEKLAYDGMAYRYGTRNAVAKARVRKELDIIDKLGFSSYFLITWDIIRYSMSKGFYHVGRGSGANSVVAYCLRITDVDPIELDLYFERFLNPRRSSPPDFDIDYSWRERDEVLDYIFKRYGKDHTALLGTISTFRGSSVVREFGKVYGLPKKEIDLLADYPHKADRSDPLVSRILSMGEQIRDFPNHRSIHAGGVLISECPIYDYSALDMPPKGFPTVQWDMYTAEEIGFEKFDILSQRGIGHIKDAAELIWQNRRVRVDVHDVKAFKQDKQVKQQLKTGDSIGCFYIESPGMRGLLTKLRCDDYIHLVAASSIIRPGVAKSGMMREYIYRFHHPDKFEYIHPVMKEQLQETYGVMVFQEDVLKVCHHFAGLDLADADVLRRAMSGKYRSKAEFQRIVDKFFANCAERGYPESIAKEVWRQVESFAGYSFSKAHSASFAVESFQSLFLKTYYPMEFMVAVINNFGGFYSTWVYVRELMKTGARVHLPCINHSEYLTNLDGEDAWLGFIHVQNLENEVIHQLVAEREEHGPYLSLQDLLARVSIGLEQLMILVKIGALRFTGLGKKQLMWDAHLQFRQHQEHVGARARVHEQPALSDIFLPVHLHKITDYTLPALVHDPLEDVYDEIEFLGFALSRSEFDLLQTSFRGGIRAADMKRHKGETVRMLGELICTKSVKTVKGEYMCFGTFYDPDFNFFDSTHFPPSLKQYPLEGRGVYLLEGKITEEFGYFTIEVSRCSKLARKPDPRY
ncbi:MAG: DNA polymerase III subunit alpha [Bacteroidia bacterium]|nr:DNA polymerase III subunit alpha [Bacteroidia bacterium]